MNPSVLDSIFCEPVSNYELSQLIYSLQSNKASGADGIGAQLIKDNCQIFLEPLNFLFSTNFASEYF